MCRYPSSPSLPKIFCNFQAILHSLQSCEEDEFFLTIKDAKFIYTVKDLEVTWLREGKNTYFFAKFKGKGGRMDVKQEGSG